MEFPFVDLKSQYRKYKLEIDKSIERVLNSTSFILGEEVASLEKELSEYIGSKHTIACASGTDSLLVSLMVFDIGYGDEVITTPFTFVSTAEVIAFLGAKPVFVDIEHDTYNIDPQKIKNAITSKTKAIIPVSLFGQPADMDKINNIAKDNRLKVIEDACQSFGAKYKDKHSCNLSEIGCTSFFPAKTLGCYGDGGAIFTDNDSLMEKIRIILNHGQLDRYHIQRIGVNSRLDAIQAAILRVKLKYIDTEIKKRQDFAKRYDEIFSKLNISPPYIKNDRTSVYSQYTIRSKNRKADIEKLNNDGVPTAVYYPIPLHLQEGFKYLGYKEGDFLVSERASKEVLSFPISAFLTKQQQNLVASSLVGVKSSA